ncbi:hypothetical protein IEQ34_016760 [Dendrobium chrysotoxum]|uniref:Uncharacterized protein n=1 Tax=Dendrobium chrysotoxum TaxID=161865 RepID=A0AAV7GFG9_DENCH|nr:hypothetical protein IEQ34_016760 [Dendrobium chrysotoxum]
MPYSKELQVVLVQKQLVCFLCVHIILGVRNVSADNNVKKMILKEIPIAKVDALKLYLRSMASVSKIAADFNSLNLPLYILINNAAVGMSSFILSQDGIEMNFATKHIGHFLLTNLLLENMKVTASKSAMEERIVIIASEAYKLSYCQGIRFDKINEKFEFNGFAAYGLEADSFVQNSLLWCNAKGCLESACKLFDELTEKNLFL